MTTRHATSLIDRDTAEAERRGEAKIVKDDFE